MRFFAKEKGILRLPFDPMSQLRRTGDDMPRRGRSRPPDATVGRDHIDQTCSTRAAGPSARTAPSGSLMPHSLQMSGAPKARKRVAPGKRSAARGDRWSIIKPQRGDRKLLPGKTFRLRPWGFSRCHPDPGLRFACPGLWAAGPFGPMNCQHQELCDISLAAGDYFAQSPMTFTISCVSRRAAGA